MLDGSREDGRVLHWFGYLQVGLPHKKVIFWVKQNEKEYYSIEWMA